METCDAIQVIDAIRQSIVREPSQFKITVNVTGQTIESHGGTGLSITAIGGGIGSTTIGQKVSLDGVQIKIARAKGMEAMDHEMQKVAKTLDTITAQLESGTPDKSVITGVYKNLMNSWVPGVITSVLGSVLATWIRS